MTYKDKSYPSQVMEALKTACETALEQRQLVMLNFLTACKGTMRWLTCALVNSMWLTAVME
jgi:hypothetical protein